MTPPPTSTPPLGYSRQHPIRARLLSNTRLNHQDSAKDTRHVELDLGDSGVTYEPGDSLGVLPLNSPDLVRSVLAELGADPEGSVPTPDGVTRPLREALASDYTITRVKPALVELLARSASDRTQARALEALLVDPDASLAGIDLADLLRQFPSARPRPNELVTTLSKLQPRLYSICSSLKAHPREVHLTVGIVRYQSRGKWQEGVASTFLGVRSLPGSEIRAFVHRSPRFRLPPDPNRPIIMIGPGTGIAPFRAFLEERAITRAPGKNWLFFGDQYRMLDFLYRDDWQRLSQAGVLTRLDTAFSRDQSAKVYVQHRLLANGAEVWSWLQAGANFYVCGDAKRMAKDVDFALQTIVAQHGGMSDAEAKTHVLGLAKASRYLRDVY